MGSENITPPESTAVVPPVRAKFISGGADGAEIRVADDEGAEGAGKEDAGKLAELVGENPPGQGDPKIDRIIERARAYGVARTVCRKSHTTLWTVKNRKDGLS